MQKPPESLARNTTTQCLAENAGARSGTRKRVIAPFAKEAKQKRITVMQKLLDYFSPHRRIARRLRWLQRYAGKHYFTIATGEFGKMAQDFERFEP